MTEEQKKTDDALYAAEAAAGAAIELPRLLAHILEERGLVSSADLRQALIAAVEMYRVSGDPVTTQIMENTVRKILNEDIGPISRHRTGHA